MANPILSLDDVSAKLGVSPSAIKKRVANLNLPVERGARGKLLFNAHAYDLLCQADKLLKAGHGFEDCRRQLGLDGGPEVAIAPEELEAIEDTGTAEEAVAEAAEAAVEAVAEPVVETAPVEAIVPAAAPVEAIVPAAAPEPASAPVEAEHAVSAAQAEARVEQSPQSARVAAAQALPAPVFIQLGRRKPSDSVRMRMIEHQPTPTPMPASAIEEARAVEAAASVVAETPVPAPVAAPAPYPVVAADPDFMARLDAALKLIEDKDRQNHTLQSKLLVAYDEMTKLSATAAAFQERSMNLQHEVQKLQGEIRLLTAPPEKKPWWKFWA